MFSNKYLYWLYLFLLVSILTLINNYYFYAHIERANIRSAKSLELVVNDLLEFCAQNKINQKICEENIAKILADNEKYNYYRTSFILKSSSGRILYKKKRNDFDKIVKQDVLIELPEIDKSAMATFSVTNEWNNINIIRSVIRSMTFSIFQVYDIYRNKGFDAAWSFFKTVAWYRSRPAIGFTIFGFLVLWAYRRREKQILLEQKEKDEELRKSFLKQLQQRDAIDPDLLENLKKYEKYIDPPINTAQLEQQIELDANGMGNKFRKAIEKLIFPIFKYHFNYEPDSLSKAIHELAEKKLISQEVRNYLSIIRIYGNIDSHYSEKVEIHKSEVIALAKYLILIIEELLDKDLLNIKVETNIVTKGGLRIIKRVRKS